MPLPNVKMYILCHNEQRYEDACKEYAEWYWAHPIRMKYQDVTFENAFWRQLEEIRDEWRDCEMVGTLSSAAGKKTNLTNIDAIIRDRSKWDTTDYYHLWDTKDPISNKRHPHLLNILRDVTNTLGLEVPTEESYCNYFMAAPARMVEFIQWYETVLKPTVLAHPLSMEDAEYKGNENHKGLDSSQLTALWGNPYYPYVPFVIERLNKMFFLDTHETYLLGKLENQISLKHIVLVSHENSQTGAPIMLQQLHDYLIANKVSASLIYLNKDTPLYIRVLSKLTNIVVVCNTLVCHDIVDFCNTINVPVIWYIHEWLDRKYIQYYPFLIQDNRYYMKATRLIFPCLKAFMNHSVYSKNTIQDISRIIPHGYDFDIFYTKASESIDFIREKGLLYIGIIGVIDARKNQEAFIRNVFIPLNYVFPELRLVLVGKEATALPTFSNVIKIDCVKNAIPYINMIDILVSYSTNEVLPMNIIEACLCKKAIVASNAGGTSEIIAHETSGFIVDINDHVTTFQRLTDLIRSPTLRRQFGEAAQKHALKSYNKDITFNCFLKNITELFDARYP
jgi:glycosyltransferase involved in cell wall biosynthesis